MSENYRINSQDDNLFREITGLALNPDGYLTEPLDVERNFLLEEMKKHIKLRYSDYGEKNYYPLEPLMNHINKFTEELFEEQEGISVGTEIELGERAIYLLCDSPRKRLIYRLDEDSRLTGTVLGVAADREFTKKERARFIHDNDNNKTSGNLYDLHKLGIQLKLGAVATYEKNNATRRTFDASKEFNLPLSEAKDLKRITRL